MKIIQIKSLYMNILLKGKLNFSISLYKMHIDTTAQ